MRNPFARLAWSWAVLLGGALSAAPAALINELKVNPGGSSDNPFEFVELLGIPNQIVPNVYFATLEGDGTSAGVADFVVRLGTFTFGGNGLLIIQSPTMGVSVPPQTRVVTDPLFDKDGGILENGTITFMLFSSPTPIVEGTDYDRDNDGQLELLPADAQILDSVGWTDGGTFDLLYTTAILTQPVGTPDAATRFPGNNTPTSAAAWFNGDLTSGPTDITYDLARVSANFPFGNPGQGPQPVLTPGRPNSIPEPATFLGAVIGVVVLASYLRRRSGR